MRLAYIAADRMDISFISKEIARTMANPTVDALEAMKRCVRYLKGKPRAVLVYERQPPPSCLTGFSDSDWAGCVVTRKSTSCSIIVHGKHYLCGTSNTQQVLALSSPEAEYYALVRGSSRVLGCLAMIRDFGCSLTGMVYTDSSGAKSIASRRGAGKIRHIETQTLWLQDVVARKKLLLRKVPGKENPADIGTKYLGTAAEYSSIMDRLGFQFRLGSSALSKSAAV